MSRLRTLKPTLGTLNTNRLPTIQKTANPDSWRHSKDSSTARGYGYAWQKARLGHLRSHPLCVMCQEEGFIRAATVVDHKVAHKGDQDVFWDRDNWQSLCATHHSSDKQREEKSGRRKKTVGSDGWAV